MYGALHGSTLDGHVFRGFGDEASDAQAAADAICGNVKNSTVQDACQIARDAAAAAASFAWAGPIGAGIAGGAVAVFETLQKIGGTCEGYVPADDRGELPLAIANEMYKIDYRIVNLPESARCTGKIGDMIDAARTNAWNALIDKWDQLSVAQQAYANKLALRVAASPPLDTSEPWLFWTPGAETPDEKLARAQQLAALAAVKGQTAAQGQGIATQQARTTAANKLLIAALASRQVADQAQAQGDSVAAAEAANRAKSLTLLAGMHSGGAISKDGTARVSSGSHTGLIVAGVLAIAAGGAVYYKYGRKKH